MEVTEPSAKYLLGQSYKKTEVGVIPEDWHVKPLRALTTLMTNGFVGVATRHYAKNESGVLYIQGYNVEENAFNFRGIKYVTESFHRKHLKSCLREGDLLTVQTGDVGLTTYVPASLEGSNCHALIISRFDQKHVAPKFVSLYLNSKPGRARMKLIETGTTMKHLNVGDMLHFEIPLPPTRAEQQAIATALSDADALIESLEQLLAKKRQIKQGAMQELLTGNRRLPGFEGEWQRKRLGELAEMGSGGTPASSNPEYYDGDIPWVAISDMTRGGRFIDGTMRNLSSLGLAHSAAQLFPAGTVLYAMYASLGECSIATVPISSSQAILGIRVRDGLNAEFLFYYLTFIKPLVKTLGQQGTQSNLNKGMVQDFNLHLPSIEEQSAIAKCLSDLDTEIEALETKLTKARQIKQGMMQELLTGRIRLVPPQTTEAQ